MGQDAALLEVTDLRVEFRTRRGSAMVLNGVDFHIRRGETLCVVGESGCGKSMTALALLRLIPSPPGQIKAGAVRFQGEDLAQATEARMREVRGDRISMIFQEPMTSLNPVFTVGDQIGESLRLHAGLDAKAARERSIEMLRSVGIPAPERRVDEYPHQLSGGMRQRVMIAMALACRPDILIADEPTTALDVTVQAEVLDLLAALVADSGMALLLISHDLGLMADRVQRLLVMYAGQAIEDGPCAEVLARPAHPYTQALLAARPRLELARGTRLATIPGRVPELHALPPGCAFADRCPRVVDRCRVVDPPPVEVGAGHTACCLRLHEVTA
ncbi:MAG: ABC transporter ATP-binding protein [Ideonella sp.]|nr:ABC transporter ATP-binding protein [Ideonella sp.]